MSLRQYLDGEAKTIFGSTNIAPYSIEIAFWMVKESNGLLTEEFVIRVLRTLGSIDYITPFTVLHQLQQAMEEADKKKTWSIFTRAIEVIEIKMMDDYDKDPRLLVALGYNPRSKNDMMDYVDTMYAKVYNTGP
jgi:hypothetical protein